MLEALSRNREIREFLGRYPTQQWKECLEAVVLVGIHALEEPTPRVEDLWVQANEGKRYGQSEGENLRSSSAPHHRQGSLVLGKPPAVQRSIPRAPIQRLNEGTPRFKQEFIQAEREHQPTKTRSSHRNLPRYLQSVQSKIRGDVKKDIAYYRYQVQTKPQEVGSMRSSGAGIRGNSPQRESPVGSQLHLESLTENRQSNYQRPADILPKPANERTFLTEPNTSLKHADELFSQLSDNSFQKPIKEETDAQVRAMPLKSPVNRSQESYSEEETGDLIHIAESFLRDPLMSHLARKDDQGVDSPRDSSVALETSQSRQSFRKRWEDTAQTEWEPQELYYTSYSSTAGRRVEGTRRLL